MFWYFFLSLSSFWNIPVTFKMALKYYSCLSDCLHGDLFILLPNLLVYVKVCGLACDFVRVHDLRADDIVRHFNGLSFLVVWLLNDASPYNFLSTTLPLDVAPVCVYMFCVNDCVCKIKSCVVVWCVVWCGVMYVWYDVFFASPYIFKRNVNEKPWYRYYNIVDLATNIW